MELKKCKQVSHASLFMCDESAVLVVKKAKKKKQRLERIECGG